MIDDADLLVRVNPASGDDAEDLPGLAHRLRVELLDLDVESVEPLPDGLAPDGAKGLPGLVDTLGIQLGTEALKTIVAKLRDWVSRNGRSIEVTIDGDSLILSRPTAAHQEQIINAWLAKHGPQA